MRQSQEPEDLVEVYWRWMALVLSSDREDRLRAGRGDEFWAWELVDDVMAEGGSSAVDLIQRLALAAPDESALGELGAGPFEKLLNLHGPQLLDELEEAIRKSNLLRGALRAVWYTPRDPAVLERLGKFGLRAG